MVSLSAESGAAVVIRHVNSEGGKRLGYCTQIEPASGCRSEDVCSQPQRIGPTESRWYAELVDVRDTQVKNSSSQREWIPT